MGVDKTIGFIGAGMMAEALASGFIDGGVIKASQVVCTDPSTARLDVFRKLGASPCENGAQVCEKADVIFVATKPQYVSVVLKENQKNLSGKLIVSIAAGVTCATIIEALGSKDAKVIRVMPNTPCLVGATAAAMCAGGGSGDAEIKIVKQLFDAVGVIEVVDEKLLAAVTGVSGSGPAYIYMIIEALSDGGVRMGLPRPQATRLAAQTVYGGAKMVLDKGKHPGQLKDEVTSPGGTTIAAVHSLEQSGIRAALIDAVVAAANKADELSKL